MNRKAYSLIEVMIAGAILLIGISAAALVANNMLAQEDANARVGAAYNMQEQAARLYQLGLSPGTITNILPANVVASQTPGTNQLFLSFTLSTNTYTNVGSVEQAVITMIFPAAIDRNGTIVRQTNSVTAVRPSIRQ